MSHDPAMDPDVPNQFRSESQSKHVFLLLLCLVVAVVVVAWIAAPRRRPPVIGDSSQPGLWLPELEALGWINGRPPRGEELRGKVVVIEVWASWSGTCREKMPHLVKLHEDYASRGVVFVGVTAEGKEDLPEVQKMIDTFGVTWPNGWGATPTIHSLQSEMLPTLYVFGPDGRMAWHSSFGGDVRRFLDHELQKLESKSGNKPT